jgi:hypothetical protein
VGEAPQVCLGLASKAGHPCNASGQLPPAARVSGEHALAAARGPAYFATFADRGTASPANIVLTNLHNIQWGDFLGKDVLSPDIGRAEAVLDGLSLRVLEDLK